LASQNLIPSWDGIVANTSIWPTPDDTSTPIRWLYCSWGRASMTALIPVVCSNSSAQPLTSVVQGCFWAIIRTVMPFPLNWSQSKAPLSAAMPPTIRPTAQITSIRRRNMALTSFVRSCCPASYFPEPPMTITARTNSA
jgi:hypothetical protein